MNAFKFTRLKSGEYSVKIYGRHGTVSSAVSVPETYCGVPVTEVTFGRTLDANFQSLHIPASVERIFFDDKINSMLFAGEITVDENNISYRSDGKALYRKDGTVLYRLFPRYIEEYSVMPGTKFINDAAFAYHRNLKRVVLPDGLVGIGEECFGGCSAIAELNIPDSVEVFGANAFKKMTALDTLKLPANLKELRTDLLNSVTLTELYIPASVERISGYVIFSSDTFIGKYVVSEENPFFRSENGIIYSKDMTVLVKAPNSVPPVFEVPGGVVRIAGQAFLNCKELTEVIFPESLEYIGDYAFCGCTLQDVVIPKNVIDIGKKALVPFRTITVFDTLKSKPPTIHVSWIGKDSLGKDPLGKDPFEKMIIVKDAQTDKIKDRVWAYILPGPYNILKTYCGCFDEKWNFDYDRFDGCFDKFGSCFTKACYAVYRLKNPHEPTTRTKAVFTDFLQEFGAEIMKQCIAFGDIEKFVWFAEYTLTEQNITEVADYAAKENAVEFTAFLLDYRDKHFGKLPDGLELK